MTIKNVQALIATAEKFYDEEYESRQDAAYFYGLEEAIHMVYEWANKVGDVCSHWEYRGLMNAIWAEADEADYQSSWGFRHLVMALDRSQSEFELTQKLEF